MRDAQGILRLSCADCACVEFIGRKAKCLDCHCLAAQHIIVDNMYGPPYKQNLQISQVESITWSFCKRSTIYGVFLLIILSLFKHPLLKQLPHINLGISKEICLVFMISTELSLLICYFN